MHLTQLHFYSCSGQFVTHRKLEGTGEISRLVISGSLAFAAAADGGLQILSLSNPTQPSLDGVYIPSAGYAFDVAAAGTAAYVATQTGLQTFDASNPGQLSEKAASRATALMCR